LGFCPGRKRLSRHLMGVIPEATQQKGKTPFLVSPKMVVTIRQWVGIRFLRTLPAITTPRLALERLASTPTPTILLSVPLRSLVTASWLTATPPSAVAHSLATPRVCKTRPAVREHFFGNTTGSGNTALAAGAGGNVVTANNVTIIGANVDGADVSNTTWIGNVYGVTTQSGTTAPVIVSDSGQLGIMASSERFKKDISTMKTASDAILSLRPVTFHYKMDTKGIPLFGLIAEEVAKVNPALVLPDKEGKPYTVRYDVVNAMLLNEFLKEHKAFIEEQRKVQEQKATIAQLKNDFGATIAQFTARLDEQASQIQRVSAQLAAVSPSDGGLEASKPAAQVVNNP
jgi:hypothetical protein